MLLHSVVTLPILMQCVTLPMLMDSVATLHMLLLCSYFACYCTVYVTLPFPLHSVVTSPMLLHSVVTLHMLLQCSYFTYVTAQCCYLR